MSVWPGLAYNFQYAVQSSAAAAKEFWLEAHKKDQGNIPMEGSLTQQSTMTAIPICSDQKQIRVHTLLLLYGSGELVPVCI